MTFIRRLASITGPLVRGLAYTAPHRKLGQKAPREITVVKAILILFLLSFHS